MFKILQRNFGMPPGGDPEPSTRQVDVIAVLAIVIVTIILCAFGIVIS